MLCSSNNLQDLATHAAVARSNAIVSGRVQAVSGRGLTALIHRDEAEPRNEVDKRRMLS